MKRRATLLLLGMSTCAPRLLLAQSRVYRIGTLAGSSPNSLGGEAVNAFRAGMRELGYVEVQHYVLETRFAEGQYERYPALAADLVRLKVDVIVTFGGPAATRAAQQATKWIPIVMSAGGDPVALGLVASLARPGGNVTGLTNLTSDLGPKRFELLSSVVPRLLHVAVLLNPAIPGKQLHTIVAATREIKIQVSAANVQSEEDFDAAFATMARDGVQAVVISSDPLLNAHSRRLAQLALKHRLPSIAVAARYVEAGGLMSYGDPDLWNYHRAAYFVDRILKGAKPGDLPIEQPTKVELTINRKTAKALGITIPQAILLRADKLIE